MGRDFFKATQIDFFPKQINYSSNSLSELCSSFSICSYWTRQGKGHPLKIQRNGIIVVKGREDFCSYKLYKVEGNWLFSFGVPTITENLECLFYI